MSTSSNKKRLHQIELQLSPKDCAIWLVDEARKYPSGQYFLKAVAKGKFEEWPTIVPFHRLLEQAERRYPNRNPEEMKARKKLSRKLRTEFFFFRRLFFDVNEATEEKTTALGSRAALILCRFETLIRQDAFNRTARRAASWIERYKTTGGKEQEERQTMLDELASCSSVSLGEGPVDTAVAGPGEGLADELTMLLADVFAHGAAVRTIEETYFDDHRILLPDLEGKLSDMLKAAQDAVNAFNEYLKTRSQLSQENGDQEEQESGTTSAKPGDGERQLSIDIDATQEYAAELACPLAGDWAKEVKERAIIESLKEIGQHGDYMVQRLRRKFGIKP